jgi:hypothetical protein
MASVNNATGVYATLGYNFSDPNGDILNLSANTVAHLNSMPAFIDTWQAQDIANNTVGGYYQNPVASNTNLIITNTQTMITVANAGFSQNIANCDLIESAANALSIVAQSFLDHTNRISGVTVFTGQDVVNPYYDTAMGLGKTALYITNQTDNITNTSPILGSFTSILIGPQVGTANTTITNNLIVLTNGVTANNLTETQISQILSDISNTSTLLSTRQSADVTYYGNLRTFVDNYNITKKFSNMGETETYLVNNFVGTDKIKERINS